MELSLRHTICRFNIFEIFHEVFEGFHIGSLCYQCVLQHVQLLVVELVTYFKNYCLIIKNKNY